MRVVALFTLTAICAWSQHLIFEPDSTGTAFVARTRSGAVLVHSGGAVLKPAGDGPVRMNIERSRASGVVPLDRLPGVSNYFRGNDPAQWRTNVPQYGRIRYKDVYPGIDLVYYGNDHRLEYDFIVAPGANPDVIELAFHNAGRITTASNGDLLIEANGEIIRQLRPRVYQWDRGRKKEIAGAYRVRSGGAVQFALSRYDRTRELIIDPVIQYSTYIGRGGQESGVGVAVDAAGNSYIVGETTSGELATTGVAQGVRAGDQDAFIAKLSPTGSVLYVSYLGGNRTDTGLGIAVDDAGNAYVTGVTFSTNFPVRSEYSAELAGGSFDSFVAKLNPTGTALAYSTYLGGRNEEWASGIAVDSLGGAWVTGWTTSPNFPVRTPYQSASAGGGEDIFVTRLSPTGSGITYSTFFGGNGRDLSTGIAVDAAGAVYVSGGTTSTAFPLANAAQRTNAGGQDAFAFKLVPSTNSLEYSTFLGGTAEDLAVKIAVDPAGNAYITGYTKSTGFPTTGGSFQPRSSGATDIFAAKIAPTGALEYSTHIGGSADDWAGSIAVDAAGTAYVSGWTNSANFPLRNPVQGTYQGGDAGQNFDAIVTRISPNGDDLLYSTFVGGRGEDKAYGIAFDRGNNVVIAGSTTSPNLPAPNNEFSPSGRGIADVFLTRISADAAVTVLAARPASLTFTARTAEPMPASQTVVLSSTGLPQSFQTARSVPWIVLRPENGSTPSNLEVSVDASGLTPGTHTGEITLRSAVSTLRIPVTLTLLVAPNIVSVTPSPISRSDVDVAITITGGGFTSASAVEVNGIRAATTFVDSRNLRAVIPSSLTFQQGALSIAVVNPDARSNATTVQVVTTSQATIVHGATRQGGPIAPGQIVILTGAPIGADVIAAPQDGRLPATLSDTRVLFDETPAPILWLQAGQIAAIAPYNLHGRASVPVVIEHRGVRSTPASVVVAPASPGIFTADGRQAAALNENGSLNSSGNPAARGSILVLYATGEGLTNPTLPDGSIVPLTANTPKPMLPVSVVVGGFSAEVLYAGAVPGSAAGLLQINVRLPEGISAGPQPVTLTVGGASSPAGVTAAIR